MLGIINQTSTKMPANMFSEVNANQIPEDHRALQLAFELSVLRMNGDEEVPNLASSTMDSETARKRSANMTECVPVPSSEHVAEIVGRQGCKIKALRAKTNTYIKTPVRGEEPVFVVTGRKEDVGMAKREILSAAEHFSQIRASRRNSSVSSSSSVTTAGPNGPPSPSTPGQVTIQVRVPYRVVGLVVGPKGATIKRIQQQTHTYIVTPSRDKEPVFEVTGLPENVEKAKMEIESHIAIRTGGVIDGQNEDDFQTNGIDSGFHELHGNSDIFGFGKAHNGMNALNNFHNLQNGNPLHNGDTNIFNFPSVSGPKINDFALGNMIGTFNCFGSFDNDEGIGGSPSFDPFIPSHSMWSDVDNSNLVTSVFTTSTGNPHRGPSSLGNSTPRQMSPSITDSPNSSSNGNSSSNPPSPPLSLLEGMGNTGLLKPSLNGTQGSNFPHTSVMDMGLVTSLSPAITTASHVKTSGGVSIPVQVPMVNGRPRRQCLMCSDSEIVAALVPCGHNLFCMECANLIVEKPVSERSCPVCSQTISQAMRIFS